MSTFTPAVSAEEFAAEYAKDSGYTVQQVLSVMTPLPCRCGKRYCLGWAMVSDAAISRSTHEELYGDKQ